MWWKRFVKRHSLRRSKPFIYLPLMIILLCISIGYAYLNTSLYINGTSMLASARWDVHFDNIQVKDGSVTPTIEPTITDDTTVSFSVTLENPGDYYDFNIDVVNAGTINAMIDSFSIQPVLTENQQKYLEYSVTYEDGTALGEKQRLDAGDSETLRIAFIYKEASDPDDYPDEDEDISIEVSIVYIQENGDAVDVPHPPTLYNVLKDAAEDGTYAKEYTGNHQDSMDASKSTQKIYYYYGSNFTNGTAILDKNNVLFAGQCWRMIRTTDTGGVKMIYNGEAENNQCLNTRGTHVGYASRTSQNLASNYWYGTDYIYDSTNKTFKVSGTTEQTMWNESNGPGLVGKYTCKSTSVDGTCATLYLVESYYTMSSAYVIPLNSNSNYSQFGTLQFNANPSSPADVGYMYNTRYTYNSKSMTSNETILRGTSLNTSYWYAHNVVWGSPVANRYNLDNPYQVSATTDYPNLVGKYTFRSSSQTNTATNVYYIAAVEGGVMYYIELVNSGNHTLSDFNFTYTYGDSFTDNGDGTYTIDNPTTIERKDWYTSYSSVGANKYVCKNAVNDTCSELLYTTATSTTSMTYIKVANNYKYSKGFTWDGSKYVLDDDTSVNFWNINDSTNKNSLNNAHYTCWNTTGECTTLSYICYIHISGTTPYYVNLTSGKSIEEAKNEMLYNNDVNTINSIMKSGVDAWYKHYLLEDYDDYIEDTIFCNDRTQSNADANGWNPNGGSVSTYMYFKGHNVTSDLSCTNTTDRFSVSNPSATLTYKVGLMSSPEMIILGNSNIRKTGQEYWLASPNYFSGSDAVGRKVDVSGNVSDFRVSFSDDGVRPAVSLKPGITYSTGDGSMANPYVVTTTLS